MAPRVSQHQRQLVQAVRAMGALAFVLVTACLVWGIVTHHYFPLPLGVMAAFCYTIYLVAFAALIASHRSVRVQVERPWSLSVQAVLIATALVAVYVGAVPALAWPVLLIGGVSFAFGVAAWHRAHA